MKQDFCLSAQGRLLRVWQDRNRVMSVPGPETGESVLWIYGASCARISAVFICRKFLKPKGRDGWTEGSLQDEQDSGIWALSKRQGGSMYTRDPHLMKRVYGFRKENQLIVLQYEHAGRPQADL